MNNDEENIKNKANKTKKINGMQKKKKIYSKLAKQTQSIDAAEVATYEQDTHELFDGIIDAKDGQKVVGTYVIYDSQGSHIKETGMYRAGTQCPDYIQYNEDNEAIPDTLDLNVQLMRKYQSEQQSNDEQNKKKFIIHNPKNKKMKKKNINVFSALQKSKNNNHKETKLTIIKVPKRAKYPLIKQETLNKNKINNTGCTKISLKRKKQAKIK